MFKKQSPEVREEIFFKRYPNLKMVANEVEVPYPSKEFLPLNIGDNYLYLKDEEGNRTEILNFEFDLEHSYKFVIDHNHKQFFWNIKIQFIILVLVSLMWVTIVDANLYSMELLDSIFSIGPVVAITYFVIRYLVSKQDISAYVLKVVKIPKRENNNQNIK